MQTGWSNLDTPLISKVVRILAILNNLINFYRPKATMLKKLIEADPLSTLGFISGSGDWRQGPGHLFPGPGTCIDSVATSCGGR